MDRVHDDPTNATTRSWRGVAAAMFAIAWGGNEFTPLLVMYKNDHGFSGPVVDALLFAYVVGIVPALLVGGPLSDRLGRRRLMRPAPVIAALGSAVLALGADSVALLALGRVCSGVGLGLAMAVGTSWMKELSSATRTDDAGHPDRTATLGARRAAMSLTAGFGVGAGAAGVLAQWAPWPDTLAYLVNVGLCAVAVVWMRRTPETRPPQPRSSGAPLRLRDDLRLTGVRHRRFLRVVVPLAPWVFGAAAAAYAVLPTLMATRMGDLQVAYAALVTLVTLASGFAVQSVARRIDSPETARGSVVALVLLMAGMGLGAVAAAVLDPWLTLVTGALLGCGYGLALVAGLTEVSRIAGPADLAGLNAVFYSLTYLGFGAPVVLALVHDAVPALNYPVLFAVGVGVAALSLVSVLGEYRARSGAQVSDESPALR